MKPQNKRKGRRVLAAAYHLSEAGPFVNQVILANMASFAGSLHGIYYNIMMPLINNLSLF